MRRATRALAIAAVAGMVAILAFPAFLKLRSGGTKAFEPQMMDFALLGASTFAIALGAQVVPWRRMRSVAFLGVVSGAALLFGALAIFSIGLAVLPAGIVLLLFLYRRLRRTPASWVRTRAALGGALIGFGCPLLFIALIVPATVECFPNGTGTSSGRWGGNGYSVSSTGSVSADSRISSGRMETTNSVVTYRCENGRLVEFQRTTK